MQIKKWKLKLGIGIAVVVGIIVLVVLLVTLVFNRCNSPMILSKALDIFDDFQGNTRIIWSGVTVSSVCAENYLLRYTIDGRTAVEIPTTLTTYNITNSPICSNIYFQLWTVSESGKLSDDFIGLNHTVHHPSAYMTYVDLTRTDAGLVGSWRKPEMLESCEVSYKIRYTTELGVYNYSTVNEYHVVPENIYCFIVRMKVAIVVGLSEGSYSYEAIGYGEDIEVNTEISPEDRNILIATWSHSKVDLCSVTYNITRAGEEEKWYIVSEPIVNLDIKYCIQDSFTIIPLAFGGTYSGLATTTDITHYPDPELIGLVEFGPFIQEFNSLIISWIEVPQPIPGCVVTYQIDIAGELGNATQYSAVPMSEIFRRYFCFDVEIEVRPVIDLVVGESTRTTYRYDVNPVIKLEITPFTSNYSLIATWDTDLWRISCEIEHVVTYQYGEITESVITKQNIATFNLYFCGGTTISITTVYNELKSEERSATYTADTPKLLPTPENVELKTIDTTGIISWEIPEFFSFCPELYMVIVINENLGIESRCIGTTGCNITLEDFCPYVNVTISPRSTSGDNFQETYSCDEII